MKSSELRYRVDLERDALTYVSGAEVRQPEIYAESVPSAVEFLSGYEQWKAQDLAAMITARVTIRNRPDRPVMPQDRVVFEGKRLEIKAVIPTENNFQFLQLECSANG